MNDRLLRVTAILSVLALVATAGAGAVAAQEDFSVSDLDVSVAGNSQGPDAAAELDEDLTITANVTNTGPDAGSQNVSFRLNASGAPLNSAAIVAPVQNVTLASGASTTVTFFPGSGDTPSALGLAAGEYDHGVFSVNTTTSTVNGSALGNLSVIDEGDNNLVSGIISDEQFNPIVRSGKVTFNITYIGGSGNRSSDLRVVRSVNVENFTDGDADPNDGIAGSVGPNTGFQEDVAGPNNDLDRYRISLPNFGAGTKYDIEANLTGFKAADGITDELDPGDGDTQDIQLERIALPERFDITQSAESALADGEDSILFNVSIIGDVDGERLTNEGFRVFHDGGSAVTPANGTSFNTGSDGFVEFEATSNVSQVVNFRFVADDVDRMGNKVVEIRQKTFVIEGEGTVIGDVWDASLSPGFAPEHSLPNAKVWAFQKDVFQSQSIRVPPNESSIGDTETAFVNESQDSFFRLVESEDNTTTTPSDDEILDVTQDYRIDNDGQNENLSISRVRELDENDSSVGSGWAVRANTDNPCASNLTGTCLGTGMYVTPLESDPESFYYVEQSDNRVNASDKRFVDAGVGDDPFSVYEISGTSQYAAARNQTPNQPTQPTVRRTGNLTFEAAQEFSTFSGQQLWDITDENGEYILDDLFTDFQAGIDYTIVANKPGYEVEFVDAFVTESGALFENGEDENFGLKRIEQDTDVNITNIARLPDISEAPGDNLSDPDSYDQYDYGNQTDEFSQVVPRDGESIDVIQLNTFLEGTDTPASDTVELSIPDQDNGDVADRDNFTGEFVATAGAESATLSGDTATVTTGADGQAIVWLQSDLSIESLDSVFRTNVNNDGLLCERSEPGTPLDRFEGIVAQSTTDAGAIDTSCKDFRGVNIFEAGSISGTVRNNDQGLPETVVWTREFVDTQGNLFTLTPQGGTSALASAGGSGGDSAVRDQNFTFAYYQRTGGVVPDPTTTSPTTTATFNASELTAFSAQQFGPLATPPGFNETFNLLRFPSDDPENLGDYSMDRVPAQDAIPTLSYTSNGGVNYQRIQAVQYETGETGNGTSSNPVRTGFTEEGDVVIPVAPRGVIVAPDFQLENLTPADATVTEGDDPIDVSADVNNTGLLDGTQDIELRVENVSTGTEVYNDTVSGVSVAAGDTQTVTFTDVPAGALDPGEYNHIVSSDDDTIEGNLTVEEEAEAFFEVSNVEAPDTEKPENVTITADVENTGDAEATQDISFLLEGEDTTVGGGALDIVFTFDTTSSMLEEIDGAQSSISAFTDQVDDSGADARYGLISFKNDDSSVTIEQDLTDDASAVQSAINGLSASGGGEQPEASYEAIRAGVEDTDRRSSARLVVIHVTDAPAHYDGDGFDTTDLTRSDTASTLNGADARFVCACFAGEDVFGSVDPEANVTDMAINDVDDSVFVRLASGDFSDTLTDEIATAVTEAAGGVELNLNGGESDTVSFEVPTENLSTGLYDVTVNSEDDSGSTTTNITEAAVGELTFNDQALASDGTVTVEDVSTGQPSTVVVTYTDGSEEVIAGINGSADNLDNEDVSVEIEDTGGFPGEHTAWVFDDDDVPAGVGIGDDATPIAGAALDSETAFVSEASPSPIDGVSDELWTAVTSQDGDEGNLSLSDVGDAINAYQSNPGSAEIDGVPISLGELGDIISYYQDEVA